MAREIKGKRQQRLLAEAKILAENPDIGDIAMVEELAKQGISTTRQTVHADKKLNLEAMSVKDIKKSKSGLIQELDTIINIAFNKSVGGGADALRAMNSYNKLIKTKASILDAFEQAKLKANAPERPIINVIIGKPKEYKKDGKDEKNDE